MEAQHDLLGIHCVLAASAASPRNAGRQVHLRGDESIMVMSRTPRLRKEELTAEMVRDFFSYDPEDGILYWKNPTANNVKIGDPAGSPSKQGYLSVRIFHQRHAVHRLIWMLLYERWPTAEIDHRDGNKSNNRLANLREASRVQNARNVVNKGYSYNRRDKKYIAQTEVGGQTIYLGRFDTAAEAIEAYRTAHLQLAGDFSFYNRPAGGQAPEYAACPPAPSSPGVQR